MWIYIIAYIIILVLIFIDKKISIKNKKKYLAYWVVFITLISGLRDMLGGYDSYIYAEVFDSTSDQLDAGIPIYKTTAILLNPTELGFGYFNVAIACITANRYIFLLIISILVFYSLYHHITRYSRYPLLAFFILWCLWYFFSFTYLRQVMAACICWYAVPYAINRKPWQFFAIVTLAFSFHNSAALFYFVYFIAHKQFTRNQIIQYSLISLLIGLTPVGSIIFQVIGTNINENKAGSVINHSNTANINYIIEAILFLSIFLYQYKNIAKDKKSICMFNIALLFIFTLIFFVRFSDGGRMSWYFLIGISCITAQLSMKGVNSFFVKIMVVIIVSLLYFRILFGWGGLLSPYKTFLTDGVRKNDPCARYEYDSNYDEDKLYRPIIKIFK